MAAVVVFRNRQFLFMSLTSFPPPATHTAFFFGLVRHHRSHPSNRPPRTDLWGDDEVNGERSMAEMTDMFSHQVHDACRKRHLDGQLASLLCSS